MDRVANRAKLYSLLGDLPERQPSINSRLISKDERDNYFVEKLVLEIASLICPRPHLSINGSFDRLTPQKGLDVINEELQKVYLQESCSEHFELKKYSVGHYETGEMRIDALEFLKKWL